MNIQPIHDEGAEVAVLGAILLHNEALAEVERVQPQDFYYTKHQLLFEAMLALRAAGKPIDEVTLVDQLKSTGDLEKVGGPAEVAFLSNRVPTAANIEHYA